MKKILFLMAAAIVAVVLNSCTDDGNENSLVINNGNSEVTINRLGGIVQVPIAIDGEWTATISDNSDKDDNIWSDLGADKGKGAGNLNVYVDYFDPSLQQHERKATISVTSGEVSKTITLRQYIGIQDGEAAPNADVEFSDVWFNKGLGSGYNIDLATFAGCIINMQGVKEAIQQTEYATMFRQDARPGMTVDAIMQDTMQSSLDSLHVHGMINIKFARFKLSLDVDYHNNATIIENACSYTGSQDLEYLHASLSYDDIVAILEDEWDEDTQTFPSDGMAKKLVSIGFLNRWKNVMKNLNDSAEFTKAVKILVSKNGPVFVTGSTLGGSIFTAIEYDSLFMAEKYGVYGDVKANLALSAIQITGTAGAGYGTEGSRLWENSHYYCAITGGDRNSYNAMLEQLNSNRPDREKLKVAAQQWMQSIRSSNDKDSDNTGIISIEYTGIWNLFPFEISDRIKQIVLDYYKDKRTCVDLEDMGIMMTNR